MNPFCDYMLVAKGYHFSMLVVTIIYAILCLGAFFIEEAPQEDVEEISGDKVAEVVEQKQYTTKEMMRTKQFYIISIVMALVIPAYVLVNPLMKSLGMERGLTNAQALLGVTIASFANILGRFLAPWISDKINCKRVIQVMYVIAMAAVLGLTVATGPLFIVLISAVCLVYGGVVSVFPVLTAENFGMKYQGMNYGAVMLGYGFVSILCPYLLDILGQNTALLVAGAACFVGLLGTRKF